MAIGRADLEAGITSLIEKQDKDYIISLLLSAASTNDLYDIIDRVLGRYKSDVTCAGENCVDCKAPCKTGESIEVKDDDSVEVKSDTINITVKEDPTEKDPEEEDPIEELLKFRQEASKINPSEYTTDGIQKNLTICKAISKNFGYLSVDDILRIKPLTEEQLKTLEDILRT